MSTSGSRVPVEGAHQPAQLQRVPPRDERQVGVADGELAERAVEDGGDRHPRLVAAPRNGLREPGEPHRHAGAQRRQADHPPGDDRVPGQQRDAVGGRARLLLAGRGHPGAARRAGQRGDELVLRRAHRLGGHRGQVGAERARLVAVDLLEAEHVGVQALHGGGQPVDVDAAVVQGAPVQDVEGRDAHARPVPRPGRFYRRRACGRSIAGSRTGVQPSDRDEIRDLLKRTAVALKQARRAVRPVRRLRGLGARRARARPRRRLPRAGGRGRAGARRCWPTPGLDVQEPAEDWLVKVVGEKARSSTSSGAPAGIRWRAT